MSSTLAAVERLTLDVERIRDCKSPIAGFTVDGPKPARYVRDLGEDMALVLAELSRLEEENERLMDELRDAADPIYCPICGSCGSDGCGCEHKCKYASAHPDVIAESERQEALIAALTAERDAALKAITDACDELRVAARQNEMSANIMRDPQRTGNWRGSERTAAAFDRHGLKAAGIRAKLIRAASLIKGGA